MTPSEAAKNSKSYQELHSAYVALRRASEKQKPDDIGTFTVRLNDFELAALVHFFKNADAAAFADWASDRTSQDKGEPANG